MSQPQRRKTPRKFGDLNQLEKSDSAVVKKIDAIPWLPHSAHHVNHFKSFENQRAPPRIKLRQLLLPPPYDAKMPNTSSSSLNQKQKVIAVKEITFNENCKKWLRELAVTNFKISHPNIIEYYSCAPPETTTTTTSAFDGNALSIRSSSSSNVSLDRKDTSPSSNNSVFSPSSSSSPLMGMTNNKTSTTTSNSSNNCGDHRSSSSISVVELHMEWAERFCFDELTRDIRVMIKAREKKLTNKLIILGNNSRKKQHPPTSPTQMELTQAKELAYSGLDAMVESCLKSVARQALIGLWTLHECHKILHRDVKNGNLLVKANGLVKFTDFETAISFTSLSNARANLSRIGTVGLIAPELKLLVPGDNHHSHHDQSKNHSQSNETESNSKDRAEKEEQGEKTEKHAELKKADVWSLGMSLLLTKLHLKYGKDCSFWSGKAKDMMKASSSPLSQDATDELIKQHFNDTGLKFLVRLMTKVKLSDRVSSTQALAWTFVLNPKVCSVLEIVQKEKISNRKSSSAMNSTVGNSSSGTTTTTTTTTTPQLLNDMKGWPSMKDSHRNKEAENTLKSKFGIETCDPVLVQTYKSYEYQTSSSSSSSSSPEVDRYTRGPSLESIMKSHDVIHQAFSKEAEAVHSFYSAFKNCNDPDNQLQQFQQLMYHEVLFGRQLEQVEDMKEILALVPQASKEVLLKERVE